MPGSVFLSVLAADLFAVAESGVFFLILFELPMREVFVEFPFLSGLAVGCFCVVREDGFVLPISLTIRWVLLRFIRLVVMVADGFVVVERGEFFPGP